MITSTWEQLGHIPPASLLDARLQLHWASQIVAAVGHDLVEPQPDDSHTNLEWNDALRALVSNPIADGRRVGLCLERLSLLLLDSSGQSIQETAFSGQTLPGGLVHIETVLNATLTIRREDIPDHPTATDTPFSLEPTSAFVELGHWYANADHALRLLLGHYAGGPVRCWPHHFDIATLLHIDRGERKEGIVGVGLSPGDQYYAEPYWYVSPWQKPESPDAPPLDGGGAWRPSGWFGAVLTAAELVQKGDAQAQVLDAFLQSAIQASLSIVHAAD